jgi:hypothetical protein
MYLGSANMMMHYKCGDATTGMSWNMLFDIRCCPSPRQIYNEQWEATSVWVLQHSDWNVLYHLTISKRMWASSSWDFCRICTPLISSDAVDEEGVLCSGDIRIKSLPGLGAAISQRI